MPRSDRLMAKFFEVARAAAHRLFDRADFGPAFPNGNRGFKSPSLRRRVCLSKSIPRVQAEGTGRPVSPGRVLTATGPEIDPDQEGRAVT